MSISATDSKRGTCSRVASPQDSAVEVSLSLIIPVYNRIDLTKACLASLEATLGDRTDVEVLIADDGSKDGTREWLETLPAPRYRALTGATNRGFSANNNAAVGEARGQRLLLLNNDTILTPGWLEAMEAVFRVAPNVGIVGNVQRCASGDSLDHIGVCFNRDFMPMHMGRGTTKLPREEYTRWPAVTGACWLLDRSLYERLGGLDEGFRCGFEDVDFCLRAGDLGFRHYTANRSVIFHWVSSSPGRHAHEDANTARFKELWRERLASWAGPRYAVRASYAQQRRDAWRYLRKHLWQPWRYNGTRLVAAMRGLARPAPGFPAVDEERFFV